MGVGVYGYTLHTLSLSEASSMTAPFVVAWQKKLIEALVSVMGVYKLRSGSSF